MNCPAGQAKTDLSLLTRKSSIFFMRLLLIALAAVIMAVPAHCAKKEKEKTKVYEWPAASDQETIKQAAATTSEKGLVVLERKCGLKVYGIWASLMGSNGIERDEFIRFLVVSEEGVKNAEVSLESPGLSKVEEIDARTILPDGTIIPADKDKDIEKVEISALRDRKTIYSFGKVRFPSPKVGAILEVHYRIKGYYMVLFVEEPLIYNKMPTMNLVIVFSFLDTFAGWEILALNTPQKDVLKVIETGTVELSVKNVRTSTDELSAPPDIQHQPYVVAFANFLSKEEKKGLPANWTGEIQLDDRGLPIGVDLEKSPFKVFWDNYLKELKNNRDEFVKGANLQLQLPEASLKQGTVKEKAKVLYDHAQDFARMANEEELARYRSSNKKMTLSRCFTDGFTNYEQVLLLISYLFDKAGIPYNLGIVVSRAGVRFSPYISNSYIFSPVCALRLEIDGEQPVYVTGDLNLPFGSLDAEYQHSLFFSKKSDGTIMTCETPGNQKGADRKKYVFDCAVDSVGEMKGKIRLEETGVFANDAARYLQEEARNSVQKKDKKKDKETAEELLKKKKIKDEKMESELGIPGDMLTIDGYKVIRVPRNSKEPLEIEYEVSSAKMFREMGTKSAVTLVPPLSGYSNAFVAGTRKMAIWNEDGGVVEYEGVVTLPAGSKIIDIPKQETFQLFSGWELKFEPDKGDVGGMPAAKTRVVLDVPLVIAKQQYNQWKYICSQLATIGSSYAIVEIPEGSDAE